MGGANNCTTGRNPTLADICTQHISATVNWSFIGLKEGFFVGMYKKKGPGLLWAEKKETSRRLVLFIARRVPDMQ